MKNQQPAFQVPLLTMKYTNAGSRMKSKASDKDLPIQIYEEKDKIISQIYHTVPHMFLQLAMIMNLSWIKHTCISCWDSEIPAKRSIVTY